MILESVGGRASPPHSRGGRVGDHRRFGDSSGEPTTFDVEPVLPLPGATLYGLRDCSTSSTAYDSGVRDLGFLPRRRRRPPRPADRPHRELARAGDALEALAERRVRGKAVLSGRGAARARSTRPPPRTRPAGRPADTAGSAPARAARPGALAKRRTTTQSTAATTASKSRTGSRAGRDLRARLPPAGRASAARSGRAAARARPRRAGPAAATSIRTRARARAQPRASAGRPRSPPGSARASPRPSVRRRARVGRAPRRHLVDGENEPPCPAKCSSNVIFETRPRPRCVDASPRRTPCRYRAPTASAGAPAATRRRRTGDP